MRQQVKLGMRKRAQTIRGLVNLLRDDADYICVDTDDFDLVGLGESIREMKDTVQQVIDNIMELEYSVYLAKKDESR